MAAPTQEYPPWLTPSEVVATNAAGQVVTSTTIVYLPLTYLGPSIPLNSLFTYGGSTFPPTIVTGYITTTASPTEATSTTTTPAIPPTITSITTSISSPTSSSTTSQVSSTTTIPTVSSTSTAPTSTTTSPTTIPTLTTIPPVTTIPTTSSTTTPGVPTGSASPSGGLSRGQLVGVVVASILGLIFLFVFLLAMWLWCKGRRNRRSGQFSTITPLDDDYFIVGEDARTPGEGSPRHSGEEADPFLQRSSVTNMAQASTEMGSRPGVSRVPPPVTGSMSSSGSSSTGASGYGVLLDRPTLNVLPPTVEEELGVGGYRFSDDEMRELNRESVLPPEEEEGGEYTGAYAINKEILTPPPRIMDPDNAFAPVVFPRPPHFSSPNPRSSVQSNPSLVDAEDAALLTARRVKVGDLGPAGSSEAGPGRTGFLDAIGLAGLATLGARLSWFRPENSPPGTPHRNSRSSPTGFSAVPLADSDLETGRNQLHPEGPDSFGRNRGIGLGPDGMRPGSGVSGRSGTSASGATIYHDATTSLPGTPGLAPPPRALTPAGVALPEHAWFAGQNPIAPVPPHSPPAYDDPFVVTDSPGSDHVTRNLQLPHIEAPDADADDILDLPAPTALTHFTSSSSMRDSGTVSSIGLSKHPYPPGLEPVMKVKNWSSNDGSLSVASTNSPAWHQVTPYSGGVAEGASPGTVELDVLEEEPPNASTTWRTMASSGAGGLSEFGVGVGRRTTFGLPQLTHPNAFVPSEQGSLHSMRSHISPPSTRSTGSAPASRRDGSGSLSSTSSSARSGHSAQSSINHSLVRAGSIINDGRRRFDSHHHQLSSSSSPPHSAFGSGFPHRHRGFQTPPRAATPADLGLKHGDIPTIDGSVGSPSLPALSEDVPMPSVHFSPGASTIRTVGSTSTAMQGGRTRTTSVATAFGGDARLLEEERLPFTDGSLLGPAWTPAGP